MKLSQAYQEDGDHAQACIVEILGELKKIEAQEVTIWGKQNRLWGDLPLFGPVLTELYGKNYKSHGRRLRTYSGVCRYVSTLSDGPRISEQDSRSGFDRSEDLMKLLQCKLVQLRETSSKKVELSADALAGVVLSIACSYMKRI